MERPGPIDERASTVAAVHDGSGREPMRDLVRVAARAFAVQGAAIVESCGRKARVFVGHGLPDGARRVLGRLLHHAIATGRTLVVPDITACPERIGDPLGGGPAPFRFFAAAPILAANGEPVAALCLLDPEPRAADEADLRRDLKIHARLAAMLLEDHVSGGDGVAEQVIRATSDAIIAADEQGRIIE
ncbi:GAF domain-containing protein [Sphingomicrobium astaxanthinifaciens]|uniref:GAF domain-containing protein n=1 Tax=Sphingomicrobium astaxanthinifaciens TaxID=1227949 RepID=UPI001FCA55E3|nr:GAF domain-containing protein [Sphingomicrobium astaxanthinifaciens]MCJ7422406.1 GAF domain-containing protein [Sphingomicrobium astaxanthinifaciens]